jgi:molecular chaperone DnaK (HSP70)
MSVVGIDLGTLNSVIAVARNRGVDVVSTARPAINRLVNNKHHTDS